MQNAYTSQKRVVHLHCRQLNPVWAAFTCNWPNNWAVKNIAGPKTETVVRDSITSHVTEIL